MAANQYPGGDSAWSSRYGPPSNRDAYDKGFDAGEAGKNQTSNPYSSDPERTEWLMGWRDGSGKMESKMRESRESREARDPAVVSPGTRAVVESLLSPLDPKDAFLRQWGRPYLRETTGTVAVRESELKVDRGDLYETVDQFIKAARGAGLEVYQSGQYLYVSGNDEGRIRTFLSNKRVQPV